MAPKCLCERGTIKKEVKEAMGRPIVIVEMLGLQCGDMLLEVLFFLTVLTINGID